MNLFNENCDEDIFSGEYAKNIPSKYCDENHFCGNHAKNTLSKNHDEHSKYCDENHFLEDPTPLLERGLLRAYRAKNFFVKHGYDFPSPKTCRMTNCREMDKNVPSQESKLDTEGYKDWMAVHLTDVNE